MINPQHLYSLPKGSRKDPCPQCGRNRCFKPYINNETGEVLHPEVGRCDHEQSCGYHYTPKQYFSDHPEQKPTPSNATTFIHGQPTVLKSAIKSIINVQPEFKQTLFFDIEWAKAAIARPSTFVKWFMSLPFDDVRKLEVIKDYYVGGTASDVCLNNVNYGPATVFWMIDEQQRVHDAKLIAYQIDGHRVQGWGNSMRSICEKSGKGPQLQETEKVLFGLHLLTLYPDKPVGIVESEKTALICACQWPQYIWMATGGCGNLQPQKLRPLLSRRVVVYPDSGELDKWRKRMLESGHRNYTIVEFFEQYPPNTDIADVLLDELLAPPSAKANAAAPPAAPVEPQSSAEIAWAEMCSDNPALKILEATFDLSPIEGPCPF